ncbi:MAG: hypothetical protein ACI9XZ_003761, partial [Alphaproteobacteria bacterium]
MDHAVSSSKRLLIDLAYARLDLNLRHEEYSDHQHCCGAAA